MARAAAAPPITFAPSGPLWINFSNPANLNLTELNVKAKICDVNPVAGDKLPQHTDDKSGIGVHYVDAWIKPMNTKLEDGTPVKCKRRGLKIVLTAGAKKGEGLMRRLDVSRAEALLGFRAEISFGDGMRDLLGWLEGQQAEDAVDAAREALVARGLAR